MLRKVMDEYALIPYKETAEEIKSGDYIEVKLQLIFMSMHQR